MDDLEALSEEFWTWRTATQPCSSDDLTRVERPPGWVGDWSAGAIEARRAALAGFARRYESLDLAGAPVADQVDGRLLGSALARVRWELDLVAGWRHNACFWLDQALVPVFELLLPPPPFGPDRVTALLAQLERTPVLLEQARTHLAGDGHGAAPFARVALRLLERVPADLAAATAALEPLLPADRRPALAAATGQATGAYAAFRDWLAARVDGFTGRVAVGPAAVAYFLHRVALLPYPADALIAQARQEWNRAVGAELVAATRPAAPPVMLPDAATQVARQREDEHALRRFSEERGLLSQPDTLRHYYFRPMPPYLAPLSWVGVPDDLTSPARIGEDAYRYVPEPSADLGYFALADAYDPRHALVHEGVHAQQVALAWANPRPARRRYYDSVPPEGIAFYHEELAFQAGLYGDDPHAAATIANFQRLRTLRVPVDLELATGEIGIDEAADRLATEVPMDAETAWEEAVFFAGNPGQGLSYLVGKLQILDLLATASRGRTDFDLRAFHDRLWREGNVPLALQRWELLGAADHLEAADRLADTRTGDLDDLDDLE
ncbi:MAG: DUF885 family protein [Mycobacteriales bacterium]